LVRLDEGIKARSIDYEADALDYAPVTQFPKEKGKALIYQLVLFVIY